MATTAAPYGALPVGSLMSTGSWSAKRQPIKIASAYATAIFYGDFVTLASSGTLQKETGTTTMSPVGIFVGCEYTDPTSNQKLQSQYWPASTAASDAVGFVITDPYVIFQMQADEAIAQTGLGNNVAVVQTAGSTSIGRSKNAVDGNTIATTATLPLKIIGFVDGPDSAVGDTYTDVLCIFNPPNDLTQQGGHQLLNPFGI